MEGAFYASLFWNGMIDPPSAPIRRRQTLFAGLLKAGSGLKLQTTANRAAQSTLRNPAAYVPSHQLGDWMREHGISAFKYLSARSSDA